MSRDVVGRWPARSHRSRSHSGSAGIAGFRKEGMVSQSRWGYLASLIAVVSLSWSMPVVIAYGIWTHADVALVSVVSRFLFQDPLTG